MSHRCVLITNVRIISVYYVITSLHTHTHSLTHTHAHTHTLTHTHTHTHTHSHTHTHTNTNTHTWPLDLILCLIFHNQTAPDWTDPSVSTSTSTAVELTSCLSCAMCGIILYFCFSHATCSVALLCTGTIILLVLCIQGALVLHPNCFTPLFLNAPF